MAYCTASSYLITSRAAVLVNAVLCGMAEAGATTMFPHNSSPSGPRCLDAILDPHLIGRRTAGEARSQNAPQSTFQAAAVSLVYDYTAALFPFTCGLQEQMGTLTLHPPLLVTLQGLEGRQGNRH
ncbi:uncharacterized [Tachysurus ichikawai]